MEPEATHNFDDLIALAYANFDNIHSIVDATPNRSILRLTATFAGYRIVVTELIGEATRKYSYYLLAGDFVFVGFDNSADPRAIRLKYGTIGQEHVGNLVPHAHYENKSRLVLTEEMTFPKFVTWVKQHATS
ncbi:hypothetical protein GC175_30110 [bacterium]|nr:hypothetical protein [bacterium]